MKAATRKKLLEAWEYCDEHDKSIEFMLQYMQDVAGVDLDCVINFLTKHTEDDESGERREKFFKQNDIANPNNF